MTTSPFAHIMMFNSDIQPPGRMRPGAVVVFPNTTATRDPLVICTRRATPNTKEEIRVSMVSGTLSLFRNVKG
jgi:hypothetical protein